MDLKLSPADAVLALRRHMSSGQDLVRRIEQDYSDRSGKHRFLVDEGEPIWRRMKEEWVQDIGRSLGQIFESGVHPTEFMNTPYPSLEARSFFFTCRATLDHMGAYIQKLNEFRKEIESKPPVLVRPGILLDQDQLKSDLAIVMSDVSTDHPISVAYLDMNGLKDINDSFNHDAGTRAVDTFLLVCRNSIDGTATAYRLGTAADEVIMLMPEAEGPAALERMRRVLRRLRDAPFYPSETGDERRILTASCGVVTVFDTTVDVIRLAEAAMYRAKSESKKRAPRPSILIFQEEDAEVIG